MVEQSQPEADLKYKEVKKRLDAWLVVHKGESFDLDLVCRQAEIVSASARNYAAIELSKKVEKGLLEKRNKVYYYIDSTINIIDWVNAPDGNILDITFPYGIDDGSYFGFAENVNVNAGDIIIFAGVSNVGKTTLCLNLLWENMDKYPCTLMGNEYEPSKFKRRVSRMDWHNPLKEDGIPKFELIKRIDNWKDIIRPDNINIIDWINLGDNFYQIGTIIEGIQSKLKSGIAVIALQKDASKVLGLGGAFSEHLSSLYLTMDFGRLSVRKAKDYHGTNPNGKVYGFDIIAGTKFNNIRPLIRCQECYGHGQSKGHECSYCKGTGYHDVGVTI